MPVKGLEQLARRRALPGGNGLEVCKRSGKWASNKAVGNGTGFKLRMLRVQQDISGLQRGDLRLNFGHLAGDQVRALRAIDLVAPLGSKDLSNLSEGKTAALGALNKGQINNRLIAVAAVIVGLSLCHDKPELFVITQRMPTNATAAF